MVKVEKISIIGAGYLGSTTAQLLAIKELGDIVLLDILKGIPQGKALDLYEAGPLEGFDSRIIGTNDYRDIEGSDIVVVTSGAPRKPGQSRDELLSTNLKIVLEVSDNIRKHAPGTIIIMVANPLDVMTYVCKKVTGFPRERVFGMAGILDTARFRTFVSMELGCSVEDVCVLILGGHGDTMVPLPRYCTVSGIPLSDLMPKSKIEDIVIRTREGGGEIVKLLQTGSAYFSPSAAVAQIVESIVHEKNRILPCAAYLEGEYGIKDLCVGVPIKIGKDGCEEIIEVNLTVEERALLERSVDEVRKQTQKAKEMMAK